MCEHRKLALSAWSEFDIRPSIEVPAIIHLHAFLIFPDPIVKQLRLSDLPCPAFSVKRRAISWKYTGQPLEPGDLVLESVVQILSTSDWAL